MIKKIDNLKEANSLDEEQRALFALLDKLDIAHVTYEHPPIFTMEEGAALDLPGKIPGQHAKSLFLKGADDALWLVIACEETRVDLKGLARQLGARRFSFGKPETMQEILKVTPGSVTPFALMHDAQRRLKVVVDERFRENDFCVFHPLRNTHSTQVGFMDLLRFMDGLGFTPYITALA